MSILENISKTFHIPLFGTTKDQSIGTGTIQQTLLPLLWNLGGGTESKEKAIGALKVFCSLAHAKVWMLPDTVLLAGKQNQIVDEDKSNDDSFFEQEGVTALRSNPEKSMADVIAAHFLYIEYKLIRESWISNSWKEKAHSVRVLMEIIGIISLYHIVKFLPKVQINHPS